MALPQGRLVTRAALLVFGTVAMAQQTDQLALRSQQAKELMGQSRFLEAADIYEELCRALPANPGLRLNLGLALHMAGKPRESIPHFEAVLKTQPNALPALLSLGSARLQLNQPQQAIGPLRKAVPLDPGNPAPRGMLASALLTTGLATEAAAHFRKLTEMLPEDTKGWNGLGRSYEAMSVQAFDRLTKLAPESGYWFALVADSRNRQSQNRAAFYFYRKAAERAPKLRGVHQALAAIYRRTDHPDWAAKEEQREAALGTPQCKATRSAECDFIAGRYLALISAPATTADSLYWRVRACDALARESFDRLARLPESVELHQFLAEFHGSQGRSLEAAREWEAALRLAPGDPGIEREAAAARIAVKDFPAAQQILDHLLAREPSAADVNFLQGDLLLNQQQAERAIPFLKMAADTDATLLPAQASLARAYLQAGQGEAAIPHIQAALPLDQDGSLHFQLARAYQTSGQADLARTAMGKYQEIRAKLQADKQILEEEVLITPP
jgi:predicted Zn-dependent protease